MFVAAMSGFDRLVIDREQVEDDATRLATKNFARRRLNHKSDVRLSRLELRARRRVASARQGSDPRDDRRRPRPRSSAKPPLGVQPVSVHRPLGFGADCDVGGLIAELGAVVID